MWLFLPLLLVLAISPDQKKMSCLGEQTGCYGVRTRAVCTIGSLVEFKRKTWITT